MTRSIQPRMLAVIFLLAAAATACTSSPVEELPASSVIRWGSSFGECIGYCREDLEVTPTAVRLTRSSWDTANHPAIVEERTLDPAAWQQISQAAQQSRLHNLQDVYGCPDCADGGAEWVEVQASGPPKRVTFEYGDGPSQVASLVEQLRALRQLFPGRQ